MGIAAGSSGETPSGSTQNRQLRVVGVPGDGPHDAAALREAEIGLSVDTAVDIAIPSTSLEAALAIAGLPQIYPVWLAVILLAGGVLTQPVKTGDLPRFGSN
jgi:hypothetical protein